MIGKTSSKNRTQSTAELLLESAKDEKNRLEKQIYQEQVRALRWRATGAVSRVITPWWREFANSKEAAQIRVLLSTRHLSHIRISNRVRYLREDGREWEAEIQIAANPIPFGFGTDEVRDLELRVAQFPEGRGPSGLASSYFIHHQRRDFPTGRLELLRSDLHPIIIIDFAEQLNKHTVEALIQLFIAETLKTNA